LYAYLFIYIVIHYLKTATEQQSLILYLDNPVILPWIWSTSWGWITVWWSTTYLIHLTSCQTNSFLLLKVKTTLGGRWFCVHPWSCEENCLMDKCEYSYIQDHGGCNQYFLCWLKDWLPVVRLWYIYLSEWWH
jgi:hypothetical protein